MKFILTLILVLSVLFTTAQNYRTITKEELTGKIAGYWIGQLAGNYIGFPFENLYTETPVPVFVNRYFDYRDADSLGLKMNLNDRRGYVRIMAHAMGGAWSDDDTDIEFVMLHGLEKYGLDINYEEVAELRKKHINRFIWASNAKVKDLLHQGYIPPKTGSKELNENWYRITSQLINEIWGVVYPGMTNKAAEWGEWGAKITGDDWGTHGAVIYAAMYSAAFFENDVNELVQIGISKIPDDSPFKKAVNDLIGWHRENPDWRETRRLIHKNYYKEIDGFRIPDPVAGAVINGLSGIMALLYGEGDFTKTVQRDFQIESEFEGSFISQEVFTNDETIDVEPGTFEVEITVLDNSSGRATTRTSTATIPNPEDPQINLTTIRMSGMNLDLNNSQFTPITTYTIPAKIDSVKLEFQVTNNDLDDPLEINARLLQYPSDTTSARPMNFNNYSPSSLPYIGVDMRRAEEIDTNVR
ncbi:MAG: ADP-ribosylglycohydrolase family protein, partial [Mariniphaga sp.]